MNTLYPGLVGSFLIFFFGIFACLVLACAQTSYGANFPVNSIFIYFAVGLNRCSPVCPVIWWNFDIEIIFSGSIAECAWSNTL